MAHIQLRISYEEKQNAQKVLDELGLTMSGAIKLFLKQVVREKALPFSVSVEVEGKAEKITKAEIKEVVDNKASAWNGFSMKKIG